MAEATLVDIVIVTALKVERDAVLRQLGTHSLIQDDYDPLSYYRAQLAIPGTNEHYEVAVLTLLDMGNDEAAAATATTLRRWQPAHVVMVGIAGGVRGKVALGDIVVADFVHYYEQAKRIPKGEQRRPRQFQSDRLLYGRAFSYEASEWRGEIAAARPGDNSAPSHPPEVHFGPIGSGEKVVADNRTLPQLLAECPKLLAVAMEGAGVARAAGLDPGRPRFLEVRGICDLADAQKNDDWHRYAADAAAAFVIGLLRSRPFPPVAGREITAPDARSLLILRAQSLRPIAPGEVIGALESDLAARELETVALDFTDLVAGGGITDPEVAAHRLADPQGALFGALARRAEGDLLFHGLVHVPLAFLAGHLVSDRQPVRLLDFHPDPDGGAWSWPGSDEPFAPLAERSTPMASPGAGDAIIRVSVSYPVPPAATRVPVPEPLVEMDLAVSEPARGIIRSERQVREYGAAFRRILDRLARHEPPIGRIHVFYAGPVALAFHLGQQISENIHPPVTVWNYQRSYEWGIDLAAALAGEPCAVRPAVAAVAGEQSR